MEEKEKGRVRYLRGNKICSLCAGFRETFLNKAEEEVRSFSAAGRKRKIVSPHSEGGGGKVSLGVWVGKSSCNHSRRRHQGTSALIDRVKKKKEGTSVLLNKSEGGSCSRLSREGDKEEQREIRKEKELGHTRFLRSNSKKKKIHPDPRTQLGGGEKSQAWG